MQNTRIAIGAVAPEGSEFGDKLDITDDVTAAAASQGDQPGKADLPAPAAP